MVEVRRSTPADREAIVALCRAAVGEDDYVPAYLEAMLRDEIVLVADEAGGIVSVASGRPLVDGALWLGAARTHPGARRRGAATAIMAAFEDLARSEGRRALRLWSDASNAPAQAAIRRFEFREVARFTRLEAPPALVKGLEAVERARLDEGLVRAVAESAILSRTDFYAAPDYGFVPMRRAVLARLVEEGRVWAFHGNGLALTVDPADPYGPLAQVAVLFGDLAEVLRAARGLAEARGATRVETFVPCEPRMIAAGREAGFVPKDWGREAVLFEKPIARPDG